MLYKFCPELPQIPKNIISLVESEIRLIPNRFNGVPLSDNSVPKYSLHDATFELQEFLKPYFDSNANIAFQLITQGLPIHKDYGRTNCYNYIIETGGDVSTVWYDDNLNEIERTVFPTNVWHNINTSTYHTVVGVTGTRIAVSVWMRDERAIGDISKN